MGANKCKCPPGFVKPGGHLSICRSVMNLRSQTVAVTGLLCKDCVTCHRSRDGRHCLWHIDFEKPDQMTHFGRSQVFRTAPRNPQRYEARAHIEVRTPHLSLKCL